MPGMGHPLQTNNAFILSAFHRSLFHQLLFVLLIALVVLVAWNTLRTVQYRRAVAAGGSMPSSTAYPYPEPAARRLLRISFGLIWLFDGLLQAQASMPLGLPQGVLNPSASSSPGWVQHIVNVGTTIWENHPIPAATSAVWIQVGIGAALLLAPRGRWSQAAAILSVGWGMVVWVFGEAFGGIFGHGLTWAFGAPGAVLFYVLAGILVALPERMWETPRLGRIVTSVMGAFFVGMAVLQAWPGRGFWQGQAHGATHPGTLTGMIQSMAGTPQPGIISSWERSFASFDASHGWAVNLFLVIVLAAIGLTLLSGRKRIMRGGVIAAVVACLADWVLIEDFGFLGGVGTDPNSMIPMALVIVSGYLAIAYLPVRMEAVEPVQPATVENPVATTWWGRLDPSYAFRAIAAIGAVAVVLIGAAPMAAASTNPNADPILAEALDGTPNLLNSPAPPFTLTDQQGRAVSLASLRGQTVVLTFLDPVCTNDCPIIAQEFHQADEQLGSQAHNVKFIAVDANPIYLATAYTQAFTEREGLAGVSNWLYLTGSLPTLTQVWNSYGIEVGVSSAGAMVAHSELAYIIDANGHTRAVLDEEQGSGGSDQSSFTQLLTSQVEQVLHP
jgi:cytochrome oxidase Cu insertion factor (SCO1/SenC/PrrC family)